MCNMVSADKDMAQQLQTQMGGSALTSWALSTALVDLWLNTHVLEVRGHE